MLSDAETSGGAAIAASRLATALVEAGNDVTRIVFMPDAESHPWTTVSLNLHVREDVFLHAINSIPLGLGTAARTTLISRRLDRLLDRISPDIINVHNIHGADWPSALINVCARHAPTVWTLHDTWSFTGHCAYFYDCEKFTARCDTSCPRSGE
jgi:hypothetical protein